jgi:hypothetical protein
MNLPGSSLEYEATTPTQSRAGLGLLVLGVIAAILCVALLTGAQDNYLRLGAAAAFGLLAWFLAKSGKRRRIPVLRSIEALTNLAARTEIPVVIYLRRFADDQQAHHPAATERSEHDSDEEELAESFSRICLFVAVGRPGEPLPPWGAYRLYLEDDEWEQKVNRLIAIASVIFIKWADSEPLKKEIQLIEAASKLNRTIFLLPFQEHPQQLCHYLPDGPLFEIETPDKPTAQRYAAFFTTAEGAGKIHYRERELGYGEAARRVAADSFGINDLSKGQLNVMRGFYGRFENLATKALILSLYTFAASSAAAMLLLLMVLIARWLPRGVQGLFDEIAFTMLTPLGWVLIVSLGFLLLLTVVCQRIMP